MNQEDLKAALRARSRDSRRQCAMPSLDFGHGPLRFWVRPITIGDMHKYGERLRREDLLAVVELFVEKAETESGERMFTDDMVKSLMESLTPKELRELARLVGGELLDGGADMEAVVGN